MSHELSVFSRLEPLRSRAVMTALLLLMASHALADASWTPTASMNRPRYYHTASLLPQGKVLVTGGGPTEDSVLDQTELYDPTTATWTPAAPLSRPRLGHSATPLANGSLLVAGGWDGADYLVSAELYDATTNTWKATASLRQERHYHTATRLKDGRVLVVGGWNDDTTLASAELYDPATGRWSSTGSLAQARDSHAAVLLPDGKVLVMGGWGTTQYLTSAELYDPAHGTWTRAAPLRFARGYHTATALEDGKVLVAGGFDEGGLPGAAELYDPDVARWETLPSLKTARYYHTALRLPDGRVFVAGGYQADNTETASAEFYEPGSGLWVPAPPMLKTRANHTVTLLPSGQVLVVGGKSTTVLSSVEVYGDGPEPTPPPDTRLVSVPPARTRDTSATFSFESTQAGSTFECQWDDAPFAPCVSPVSVRGLAPGEHSFQVRARKGSGQRDESPARHTWSVLPPLVLPVIVSPAEGASLSERMPTFSGTAAPQASLTLTLGDKVLGSTTANARGEWHFAPSEPLNPGAHVLKVSALSEGEVSSTTPRRFTITDARPPSGPPTAEPPTAESPAVEPPTVERSGCSVGTGAPGLSLLWMVLGLLLPATRRRPVHVLASCLPLALGACTEAGAPEHVPASQRAAIDPGLDIVLNLESGSGELEMLQGAKKNLTTSLNVVNGSGQTLEILNEVHIEPATGLTLKSDYPPAGQSTSGSVSYVINQSFTGQRPGTYLVTNRAYIPHSTIEASESFLVRVLPPGGDPLVLPVGAWPGAVPPQGTTEVTFTAAISGFLSRPETMSLRREDVPGRPAVATLRDDGTRGDLLAGDGVYSTKLTLSAAQAGVLRYVATAAFPGAAGERESARFELKVTGRPALPRPAQPGRAITDPENDVTFLCDEVLVSFTEGLTESEQDALLAQRVGGTIVGGEPGLGFYQVHLPGPCSVDTVYEALSRLRQAPGIQTASPNYLGEADGFIPNDPQYASQYALDKLRADEAWVIARGSGVLVAVLDSGADVQHADLTGQVFKGYNYPSGNANPLDELGHGTSVASLIAAHGDNAVGMAGVAWNSRILAIKVIGDGGSVTTSDGIAAIKSAADQGAKIINCSWGFWAGIRSIDTAPLEAAVQYATRKGALVIAASGNAGTERLRYPCAFDDVVCVGATDAHDKRWPLSNSGGHVDLAAPGADITVPLPAGGYGAAHGTSYATAFVSGSAAVVWSYFPAWTARQVRQRLERTALPLDGAGLGSGRVDLFEAVFNGSFEDGITGWSMEGTAGSLRGLGPLLPRDRDKLAFVSSGPDVDLIQTTLDQAFTLQPGVKTLTLRFDYNFITEEYPEWVGSPYNDSIRVSLLLPTGQEVTLAQENVNTSAFTLVPGIDFPGGDDTAGTTGWKTASATLPVSAGPGRYRIRVRDEGDGVYDSNLLIDNIRFK